MIPVRTYAIRPDQLKRAHTKQALRRAEWNAARARGRAKARAAKEARRARDLAYNERRKEERRLAKANPEALLKRQQAGMTKERCRCGVTFLRRQGSEVELCCGCAAGGLPPIPSRYPNGHPLCTS